MLGPRAQTINAGRVHDHLRRRIGATRHPGRVDSSVEEVCNALGLDDAAGVGVEILVGAGAVWQGHAVVFIRREVLSGVEVP